MDTIDHFLELIHQDTYVVYWLFYIGYLFISAYLGFNKVFRANDPATGIQPGAFTRASGWLELIGVLGLLIGFFYPPMTLIPIAWLLPLSLMTIYKQFGKPRFYNLLYCCTIPVLLVIMNRSYGIIKII